MSFPLAGLRAVGAISVVALLSSCAGVPSKDDAIGIDPTAVSEALRCEMRDGIVSLLGAATGFYDENAQDAAALSRDKLAAYEPPDPAGKFDRDDRREKRAQHEADAFDRFLANGYKHLHRRDAALEQLVETYSKMSIGWVFNFDITQTDSLDSSIDLTSVFTRGVLSTSISASAEGIRQSQDKWVAYDRADLMLSNLPLIRICNDIREANAQPDGPHLVYPITGNLGLKGWLSGFINKNQSGNLIGEKSEAELLLGTNSKPIPNEVVNLIFTTTLKSGLNPQIQLNPLPRTNIKQAMINAKRERKDVHSVAIYFVLPSIGDLTIAEARSAREKKELASHIGDVQQVIATDRLSTRDAGVNALAKSIVNQ